MSLPFARALCLSVVVLVCAAFARPAQAAFHLMQIEQVIGGVNGDVTAQAIQLRMRSAGQNFVGSTRIRAWDATGANPVMIIDFGASVPVSAAGSRILIASAGFLTKTTPTAAPDFMMTNLIPASYLAAGRLTFEDDTGNIFWSLAWGGAGYSGSNTGLAGVNDTDGNFGPPFGSPMPSAGVNAILFPGAFGAMSTTNAADYIITAGAAVFTSNNNSQFTVAAGACCPAGGGACIQATVAGCAGGQFQGVGTLCGPNTCGAPTNGACCCGSACTDVADAGLCTSPGAGVQVVFVPGGNCNPFSVTTPCCRANFNRSVIPPVISSQDIFDFLAAFFSTNTGIKTCADFNGAPPNSANVTSQDIFDFLAAFFRPGGCAP